MDPNDLIDVIVDAINYAEIARDTQGLIKARRLLNNELRQAIDLYVQGEIAKSIPPQNSSPLPSGQHPARPASPQPASLAA